MTGSTTSWISAAAFVAVAILAVRNWARRREPSSAALAWSLSLLALVTVTVPVQALFGFRLRWVSWVSMTAFVGSGYALLAYRSTIVALSRSRLVAAAVACAAALATGVAVRFPMTPGVDLTPNQVVAVNALIGVWALCVIEPIVRFQVVSRRRPPVERACFQLLSVGYMGLFAVIVLTIAILPTLKAYPARVATAQALVLPFIPLLYLASAPPERLRRVWLRRAGERGAREMMGLGTWFWDASADVVQWSKELARIHGADRVSLTMAEALQQVHPEDRETATALLAEAIHERHPVSAEHRIVTAGGRVRWLRTQAHVVTDPATGEVLGMFGTSQDVTDRKASELSLEDTTRSLAEAQRLGHLGAWHWDAASDVATWSDELYRIYGAEPFNYRPSFRAYLERVHPEHREEVRAAVERMVTKGEPFDHSYRVTRLDGEVRWVHARGEPVYDSGTISAYRGICHDITDRKAAETALTDALEREREAADRLRRLDEMKDSMLAAVSHELRTPLTVVIGLAATLQHADLDRDQAKARDLLSRLEANAYRLEGLLSDLLDLDRMSRGVVEPHRRPTNMLALTARVLETVDRSRHPVTVEADPGAVNVDPSRTERIVENLVVNAVKHTPPGTPIQVSARRLEAGVLIRVTDSGPGVPDSLKDSVFMPFRQGAPAGHAPGTGIGLSLVAKFAELHGGRAWVEDAPGGGASFNVLLPERDPAPGPDIAPRSRAPHDSYR